MMNLLIFLQVWRLYNGFIAVLSRHSFGLCRSRNTPSFSKVFSSLLVHHSWCIVRFWILQEAQGKFYQAKTLRTISCNCRRYNVPRSLPQDAWHLGFSRVDSIRQKFLHCIDRIDCFILGDKVLLAKGLHIWWRCWPSAALVWAGEPIPEIVAVKSLKNCVEQEIKV